ncbi:hypothetical protein ABFY72_29270 [Burkholderia gladioli]
MSFIFSRALVEESLQVNCGETDAYAPLNLIPTPKPSLSLGKTTAPFLRSRFGMTFEPLTADLGAELLTSWLVGFHAKTSAQPEPVTDSTVSAAGSGPKWLGSFAKYSPSESKWRTAQCSLLGDSDEFSETWPRWGSMRNGECYLRPIQMPLIYGSESGSEVMWQTPVADDAIERTAGKWNSRGEPKLSAEVKLWPTPTASLANKGGRITPRKGREGGTLIEAVSSRMYPTPVADDTGHRKAKYAQGGTPLSHFAGGQLNPEWVEWLMGWPIGHTALKPLETVRYREWLQQHSPF